MQALTKLFMVSLLVALPEPASAMPDLSRFFELESSLQPNRQACAVLLGNMEMIDISISRDSDPDMLVLQALGKSSVANKGKSAISKYWQWRQKRHARMLRVKPLMIVPVGAGYMAF